ncbi:MAG: hypothetical protein GXP52_09795 [Deltaproteobacteria bacterium]|nr:hypothetical protein [Deltaproteobacteria bacterium]
MMKDERWKLLVATSDESEINLAKRHLDAEEVQCRIEVRTHFAGDDKAGRARRFFLYVELDDFERGQQVLEGTDWEEDAR